MMINVKNHQIPPTILVDAAFGFKPDPYIYDTTIEYYELSKYDLCVF